ncbi:MAG: flagellar hook protein FlgE [Thermodesulfobacteriota bacterium]
MGLGGAMNSGVSGLQSFSNAMGVIGNNLSNTNTTGFKASRTLFSDLMPDTVSGSGGASQVGRGTSLSKVDNLFSQGSIESTNSNLDLAIEGSGFFMLRSPDSEANHFSRAGTFRLDEEGYLVNPEGYRVQGYAMNKDGSSEDLASDIQINTRSFVPGEASSKVELTTNLDAESSPPSNPWDIDDPSATSNFATTSEVYDSLGNTHLITTYFNKTASNTWNYHQTVAKDEVDAPDDIIEEGSSLYEVGTGELEFNGDGSLKTIDNGGNGTVDVDLDANPDADPVITSIAENQLKWNNGAETEQSLDYSMEVTQYATDSKVVSQSADGYASGNFTDLAIDSEGTITSSYSNGVSRDLSVLTLGKFSNKNGLEKLGKNLFAETKDSGAPVLGTAASGIGKVFSNSLEQSTVDIAEEFTKMITTQRSFQANSKTITTTDKMLNDVINLKR